jgi:chorismate mutase-like protein
MLKMTGDPNVQGESLDDLRRAIDRIDDTVLDLLIERATLGAHIAAAKRASGSEEAQGTVFLRPGREMEILRRLVSRATGPLPKAVVVRMWRELFAALISLQGPMSVAVYMPTRGAGFLELARDHYGSLTTMQPSQTTGPVVRAVADGEATVGILPLPRLEGDNPWWPSLVSSTPDTPRIISRLPLCGPGTGRGDGVEALSIGRMLPEKTGKDRSLIALETGSDVSRGGIRSIIEASELPILEFMDSFAPSEDRRLHLIEVTDYVDAQDPRLARLSTDSQIDYALVIGAYAEPFTTEDLSPDA